jgi:hypothetical protein
MADELHRSLGEAVLAAKQAASTYASGRDNRVRELQTQIQQLETLKRKIPAIAPVRQLEAARS